MHQFGVCFLPQIITHLGQCFRTADSGAYFYCNEGTLHLVQHWRLINVLLIVEQWIFAQMGICVVWLWL